MANPASYTSPYPSGWQNGSGGGTPIDAAALQVIDDGIKNLYPNTPQTGAANTFLQGQTVAQALSGSTKTFWTFNATDGKEYAFQIDTSGHLILRNLTDSVTVAQWGPTGGAFSGILAWVNALSASNQLADFEQSYGLYSDNTASTFAGGTTRLWIDTPLNGEVHIGGRSSSNVLAGMRIRAKVLQLDNNVSSAFWWPTFLQSGGAFWGVKDSSGNKLYEGKSGGNFVIGGNTYFTTGGTFNFAAGGSFDSFDYAEVYEADASYAPGTVLCPGEQGKLTRCTHDACPAAMIVSVQGGYVIGEPDQKKGLLPIALAGRVRAQAGRAIQPRTLLCSDGTGGVRALRPGEWAWCLGFALHETSEGQVGIFLRPSFARGSRRSWLKRLFFHAS